jgi:WD40 repeat protein
VRWRPPNGLQLADAAVSGGIGILDPVTGEAMSLAPIGGTSLDRSPDGSKLVSGSGYENEVYVADMAAGQQIMVLEGHIAPITTVDWSPDGQKLASGGGLDDPTMRVWDAVTGQDLLQRHTVAISEVRWNPDSSLLASAGDDGTVRIWDATTGEQLEIFEYPGRVYAVDWSPDSSRIAYAGNRNDGRNANVEIVELFPQLTATVMPTDESIVGQLSPKRQTVLPHPALLSP